MSIISSLYTACLGGLRYGATPPRCTFPCLLVLELGGLPDFIWTPGETRLPTSKFGRCHLGPSRIPTYVCHFQSCRIVTYRIRMFNGAPLCTANRTAASQKCIGGRHHAWHSRSSGRVAYGVIPACIALDRPLSSTIPGRPDPNARALAFLCSGTRKPMHSPKASSPHGATTAPTRLG